MSWAFLVLVCSCSLRSLENPKGMRRGGFEAWKDGRKKKKKRMKSLSVGGNSDGWWLPTGWGAGHDSVGSKSITSLHPTFAVPERGEQGRAAQNIR